MRSAGVPTTPSDQETSRSATLGELKLVRRAVFLQMIDAKARRIGVWNGETVSTTRHLN